MKKLILQEILAGGEIVTYPLENLQQIQHVPAQPGAVYTVIDEEGGVVPEGLRVVRKGDGLEIEINDEKVACIDDFYSESASAAYDIDGAAGDKVLLSSEAADVADGAMVWPVEEGRDVNVLAIVGGVAAGGAVIAALSNSDSSGGSTDSSGSSTPSESTVPSDSSDDTDDDTGGNYTLTVAAVAGNFTGEALVQVYDQNGNQLTTGTLDAETGQVRFTITNGYSGPLLIMVSDNNGDAGDYLDETTGVLTDMSGVLRAMVMADGSADITASVTPLTELAVRLADIDTSNLTSDDVAVNDLVGELFGIEDITGDVTTVLDEGYNGEDGLSAAEQYGNVLAMLSGSDSTTGSMGATLDQLEGAITATGDGDLALSQDGVELLVAGAEAFESGTNGDAADIDTDDIVPPVIPDAEDGLNAEEAENGTTVYVGGAEVGDTVVIIWGTERCSYTVTADNIDTDGVASLTVAADVIAAAGDGSIAVRSQINNGNESAAVIIEVDTAGVTTDTTAPGIASVSVADGTYTLGDTVTITVTAADGETGLTLAGTFNGQTLTGITDNNDGTYTAIYTVTSGDAEVADGSAVTTNITLTDAAGNTSTAVTTVTLDGESLDTTAPAITTVAIPDTAMNIGDTVIVTLTVSSDSDTYTLVDGSTIGGFALTNLSKTGDTTYTAEFTVTEGGTDVAAADDIPVSISLKDSAGNTGSYTTAISQASDAIDANAPAVTTLSPADGATGVGLGDNLVLTFSEDVSAGSGTINIYKAGDHSLVTSIDVTDAQVSISGSTVTINPTGDLAEDTAYYVQYAAGTFVDAAGNSAAAISDATTWNFSTPDTTAPTVSSVTVPDDGAYAAGDTLSFTVNFSEDVTISGSSSTLSLVLGSATVQAAYDSSTDTSATYSYTVQSGDTDTDGIAVGSITLNGDTITDAAGNDATLTLNSVGATTGITVDTTAPAITNVSIPNSAMGIGDTVTVTITVSSDSGTYTLVDGSTIGGFTLSNLSKTGDTTYTAEFTVTEGGTAVAAASDIPVSLTLMDSAGNTDTYTTAISQDSDLVDTAKPVITAVSIADTTMNIGDVVSVSITVDSDSDTYTLASGSTIGGFTLSNLSKTGDTTYTAQFTVIEGGTDVAAASDIPVSLTLEDSVGNTGTYTTAISQASDTIDANSPTISSIAATSGTYETGETISFTVTFSENVAISGSTSTLDLVVGSDTVHAGFDSSTDNTATYTYTVQSGDLDLNGIAISALTLNSDTVTDTAGNALDSSLPATDTSGVLVDGGGPEVTLSIDNTSPAEASTDTVTITATLSQAYTSDVTVHLGYSGSATSGDDYTGADTTITITAGDTTGTADFTIVNDSAEDADETIVVDITSVDNGFESGTQQVTATITDDDGSSANNSIVVFDMVEGVSSSHSGRSFASGTSYTIYIIVDSDSAELSTDGSSSKNADATWGTWTDADNLGTDDTIVLVGNGGGVMGLFSGSHPVTAINTNNGYFHWRSSASWAAYLQPNGKLARGCNWMSGAVDLWSGTWASNPNGENGVTLNQVYMTTMPSDILTSQGLA